MPIFPLRYEDRDWTLDTDLLTTKELGPVERFTGLPGLGFLDALKPSKADGTPIKMRVADDGSIEVAETVDLSDLRLNISTATVAAFWWLFQKQAGRDPGPIEDVEVAYMPFLEALAEGFAQAAGANVGVVEADVPKAPPMSTNGTGSSTSSAGSVSVPVGASFV